MSNSGGSRDQVAALLPWAWSLVLAVVVLGPALAPGYLLTYDMVWVPDLALRPDFVGTGTALPRAVPSDAVVAVIDEVIPGMLLQKLVLLGSLTAAGAGAATLVPGPVLARLTVSSLVVWNPFVVERLVLGHWPVLLGYAALPWLVSAGRRARTNGPGAAMYLLVPLGSLSAGAGLATALVVLAFGWSGRSRQDAKLLAILIAGNAPWLVSGVLHVGDATSDARAAELFALHGEGHLAAPLAALGLGGIWNAEVVPTTRTGSLGVVMTLVVVLLAAAGLRRWLRHETGRDRTAQVCLWILGWGWAVTTWAAPGLTGWLVAHVPGGGLLRDGSRLLVLCLPLFVALSAHGATAIRCWIHDRAAALVTAVGLVLVPLALMPDAAWGMSGELGAVEYPDGYEGARSAMEDQTSEVGVRGDVVVLPFAAYRAPGWNDGHKVLDPLPRFLDVDYVSNDELMVDDVVIQGEDPRVPEVQRALGRATPDARARALADLGIGFVVRDGSGPEAGPAVAGRTVVDDDPVQVVVLDDVSPRRAPRGWSVAMGLAWAGFCGSVVFGAVACVVRRRKKRL
ncbi:hypothetical protein [Nocardioides sp. JQ2195]|uniref:hypothetical protein n=1 Tax=Nocardioides sp. JQ2195 TaxID=2592334 RepID=UPI001F0D75C3|nr:hypothetical protein [Nocardioides sp. JQ2195]